MNKQSIRAFSSGILFSVIVSLSYIYFFPDNTTQKETTREGYISIPKEELKDKERKIKSLEEKVSKLSKRSGTVEKEESNKQKTNNTLQLVLIVEKGMKSQDIVDRLAIANIIKNKEEFEDFLINEGYANKIQVGQYVVDSTMSFQEIANIITKK